MKRMKRVLIAALVGMLAILPLTGCSKDKNGSNSLNDAGNNSVVYETLPAGEDITATFGETTNYKDKLDYTINKFYDLNFEKDGNYFYAVEVTIKNNTDQEIQTNALDEISVISNGTTYDMVAANPIATLYAVRVIPNAVIYTSDKIAAGTSYTAVVCCSVQGKSEKFEFIYAPKANDGKRDTITVDIPLDDAIVIEEGAGTVPQTEAAE